MIQKIIKDINLREYVSSPLWYFLLGNLNYNDDCLACLNYPIVSLVNTELMKQQWIDFPKKISKIIKKIQVNELIFWLQNSRKPTILITSVVSGISQESFDHEEVINGHVRF